MHHRRRRNERIVLSIAGLIAAVLSVRCSVERGAHAAPNLNTARSAMRAGKLKESLAQADLGIAAAHNRTDRASEERFRLLRCEVLLFQGSAGQALTELRSTIPLSARQKMLEGLALVKLAQPEKAAELLAKAHALAEQGQNSETLIETETIQGSLLSRMKQSAQAEDTFQRALGRARTIADGSYLQAVLLLDLGMSRLARGHYEEATGFLEQSASLAGPFPNLYSVAKGNLASCYYNLGEPDRALQLQLAAIQQFERSGALPYLQAALGEAGHASLLNGDLPRGARYLGQALDLAKRTGNKADAAIWAGNLALADAELGQWDDAQKSNDEAVRLKNELSPARTNGTLVYNQLNDARIAVGRGDFAKGEDLYRQVISAQANPGVTWEAWAGLGETAMLRGQPAQASKYFETAVSIVEQTRSDLLTTEFKLPYLTRLIGVYQQYVDALMAQGNVDGALAVTESSRAQVLAQRFGSAPVRRLPAQALQKIAAASNSIFVTYWLGPRHSHAWVVTADAIRHFDLPAETEINRLSGEYDDAIHHRLVNPLATPIHAGEQLFEWLVQPALRWLPQGSHVVLVPDGSLNNLNFETLVVTGSDPHYWIEDALITVAPSITAVGSSTAAGTGQGLLAIGDPDVSDPAFPPLLHAGRELDSVASHFESGSRVVLRKQGATLKGYLSAHPGRFAAIHFAAHSTANRDSPLASAILLTGGKLYARDVISLPLEADLVTISSCQSAGLRVYSGEGLVGLAWAFLRAGARNVIAGLWDVNDQSTAILMDVTYRELAAGRRPDEALRSAKLTLIHSNTNFRKPYYWGPFQVYSTTSKNAREDGIHMPQLALHRESFR